MGGKHGRMPRASWGGVEHQAQADSLTGGGELRDGASSYGCLEMHESRGGMDSSRCQCSAKEKEDHSISSTTQPEGLKEHGGMDGRKPAFMDPRKSPLKGL